MPNSDNKLELLRECGAFLEGHFLLSSGRHSDVYVEKFRLLERPDLTAAFTVDIAGHFVDTAFDLVVGPLTGGVIVAHDVAKFLGLRLAFPERIEDRMEWRRGFKISKGTRVLICEDVITTGKSVAEVSEAVTREGGEVTGIGCLIQRGDTDLTPVPYPVVKLDLQSWTPEECPLCKQGVTLEKRGSR